MPVNRNALIRYKTIDKCLQNHFRKWTLEDLIEACSDAIYEYEGIAKGVSKRTVQADIQLMRSDKLGYNAPIVVVDKKYYTYEESDYSITNIPITVHDLDSLNETVELLRQFKGFSHFRQLDGMVQKLEDHVYSQKSRQLPVIDFEKNEDLKGLEYLDELYRSIISRKAILLTYQSFKARQATSFDFHPYLLKEFRNRWFLIGARKSEAMLLTLALDRIIKIEKTTTPYVPKPDFNASEYFRDVIGVSVSPTLSPEHIILFVTHKHAPYVLTKPLHPSQRLIDKDHYGVSISLEVQHNFELEKDILGMGDGIKVIAPERLKRSIKERLKGGFELYETEINEPGLLTSARRLKHKGYSILNHVYTSREIRKIKGLIDKWQKENMKPGNEKKKQYPDLSAIKSIIFNKNMKRIIDTINENTIILKASYTEKAIDEKSYMEWIQDVQTNKESGLDLQEICLWKEEYIIPDNSLTENGHNTFMVRIYLDDSDAYNGCLRVIPGSHNKRLSEDEIKTITGNSIPSLCEVPGGGILLFNSMLLHSTSKQNNQKKRRAIQMECYSKDKSD